MLDDELKYINELLNLAGAEPLTPKPLSYTINLFEDLTSKISPEEIIADSNEYIKAVQSFVDKVEYTMSLPKNEVQKLKDVYFNSTLTFLDTRIPNNYCKRKLFFVIGYAFSRNRGYGEIHSLVKHGHEYPNIINSMPPNIQKYARENTRQHPNKTIQNFESALLCLPFALKYGDQAIGSADLSKMCLLYNDSFAVLAKIVSGTFAGDNNFYLLTLFEPTEDTKKKIYKNQKWRLKQYMRHKRRK